MAGSQKNKNQEYLDYVNRTSPKSPMLKNMLLAFLFGGLICVNRTSLWRFIQKCFSHGY